MRRDAWDEDELNQLSEQEQMGIWVYGLDGEDGHALTPSELAAEGHEEEVLDGCVIEQALAKLKTRDRLIVTMAFGFDRPRDYDGPWPPTLADVGDYVGRRFWRNRRLPHPFGEPLTEARISQRLRAVCSTWSPEALAAVQELESGLTDVDYESPARVELADKEEERRAA